MTIKDVSLSFALYFLSFMLPLHVLPSSALAQRPAELVKTPGSSISPSPTCLYSISLINAGGHNNPLRNETKNTPECLRKMIKAGIDACKNAGFGVIKGKNLANENYLDDCVINGWLQGFTSGQDGRRYVTSEDYGSLSKML